MIDTIRFSLYGIDVQHKNKQSLDDYSSMLAMHHRNILNYIVPEHQEIYMALLAYKGVFKTFQSVEHNEISSVDEMTDEQFFNNQSIFRDSLKKSKIKKNAKYKYQKRQNLHLYQFNTMNMVKSFEHKKIVLSERIGLRLKSSNRDINFFVNVNKGCLTCEMSIPKYLYNHNIAQFIPQANSEKYRDRYSLCSWEYQSIILHKRLNDFFDSFFTELLQLLNLSMMPNYEYLSIDRIDLCYNQLYLSKEDALYSIGKMKTISNKVKNKLSLGTGQYATAIHYKMSNGATFKIYHKGSEFKKTDAKELQKINVVNIDKQMKKSKYYDFYLKYKSLIIQDFSNIYNKDNTDLTKIDNKDIELIERLKPKTKDKLKNIFYTKEEEQTMNVFDRQKLSKKFALISDLSENDKILIKKIRKYIKRIVIANVNFLQNEADKILRFEMTFRPDFMRYHYKDKIFRKDDVVHKIHKKIYNKVKKYYDLRNHKYINLDDLTIAERSFFKRYDAWRNKRLVFWLKGSKKFIRNEKTSTNFYDKEMNYYHLYSYYDKINFIFSEPDNALFSNDLLDLLLNYFRKNILKYQLKDLTFKTSLSQKLDNFNKEAKQKRIAYDENPLNINKIIDLKGDFHITKGNTLVTKPSQLLTQSELWDKGMSGVNKFKIITLVEYLKRGKSFDDYCKDFNVTKSQKSRLKKHSEAFDIFQNTFFKDRKIYCKTDFTDYYSNFDKFNYGDKFFVDKHLNTNHIQNN
jgi:hypothetical protein